jgi:hypothetical protein
MKTRIAIVLTAALVLGLGSTLALMNSACKTSGHAWCAPGSDLPHHVSAGYR